MVHSRILEKLIGSGSLSKWFGAVWNCVTLGKLCHLAEPQFPYLYMEDKDSLCFTGCHEDLGNNMHGCLAWCQVLNQCLGNIIIIS